jgi:hypothetical protein
MQLLASDLELSPDAGFWRKLKVRALIVQLSCVERALPSRCVGNRTEGVANVQNLHAACPHAFLSLVHVSGLHNGW